MRRRGGEERRREEERRSMDIYNTIWSVTWVGVADQTNHKSAQSSQIGSQTRNQGNHTEEIITSVSDVRNVENQTEIIDSLKLPAEDNSINESIVQQEISFNTKTWETTQNIQQSKEQEREEKEEIKICKRKKEENKSGNEKYQNKQEPEFQRKLKVGERSAKEEEELRREKERERVKLTKTEDEEEKERAEMKKTEERIRSLESSIQFLDLQLERISIEKMKKQRSNVQKRMTLATPIFHHSSE